MEPCPPVFQAGPSISGRPQYFRQATVGQAIAFCRLPFAFPVARYAWSLYSLRVREVRHMCRYELVILRRLPYGTPSFFRRLLSVEAFNLRISAAPPLPSIMPPVLSKTRWRYLRSSSSSGTKSFDDPANASRETGWALG